MPPSGLVLRVPYWNDHGDAGKQYAIKTHTKLLLTLMFSFNEHFRFMEMLCTALYMFSHENDKCSYKYLHAF